MRDGHGGGRRQLDGTSKCLLISLFFKKIKSGNYKHIKKNVCTVKEKISFLLLGLNVLHDFFFHFCHFHFGLAKKS